MFPLPPTLQPSNLPRTLVAGVPRKALRDVWNRLAWGPGAPLSDECIYVDPAAVRTAYQPRHDCGAPRFRRKDSGRVLDGNWDRSVVPWGDGIKERACELHFIQGLPWEDTGIFEHLMQDIRRKGVSDGCRSLEDIRERYRALDRLHAEARRSGRISPRSELDGQFRREHGGVYIHVARDGTPLKAGGGIHRLTIARLLGFPTIPAQLGVIHAEAVRSHLLDRLRHPD